MTEQHGRLPPDRGCSLHPRCLECPRLRCRYDEVDDGRAMEKEEVAARDEEMRALRRDGVSVIEMTEKYGLSSRAIYRVLNEERR